MTAILESNLSTDLRLAQMIEAEIRMILADVASIRNTSAITYLGDVAGSGSDTMQLRLAGLNGTNEMAATGEGSDASTTALTDASVTVAAARYALRRDISDLAVLTGLGNDNDPFKLAESMVASFDAAFMAAVATSVASFSSSVGTSGVDMSVDDFMDAIATLEIASVPGPFWSILHARQLADLQESLRSESGALSYSPASAELLKIAGPGLAGEFLGVQIFQSSKITSSGGNRKGCMYGENALGYVVGTPQPLVGAGGEVRPAGSPVVVEFQRDSSAALTEVVGHGYFGCAIIEDARGVLISTDA